MNKRFVMTLLACVLVLGGIFWFTRDKAGAPEGDDANVQASEHISGAEAKTHVLVEYGDFECPACLRYFPVIEEVREKYKDQLTFQFRHYPLSQLHPNAVAAHRAAEAAAAQGKFWEMYSVLYQNQNTWGAATSGTSTSQATSQFEGFASQLGLDTEKFQKDAASSNTNAIINADKTEGDRLGVSSTPTFFLNGQKLEDARNDIEWFSQQIDKVLAEKPAGGSNAPADL